MEETKEEIKVEETKVEEKNNENKVEIKEEEKTVVEDTKEEIKVESKEESKEEIKEEKKEEEKKEEEKQIKKQSIFGYFLNKNYVSIEFDNENSKNKIFKNKEKNNLIKEEFFKESDHSAFLSTKDFLFTFGGKDKDGNAHNKTTIYSEGSDDGLTITFNEDSYVPEARHSHSMSFYDNKYVVVYGGTNGEKIFDDLNLFDMGIVIL
jgi:hypothetical protein